MNSNLNKYEIFITCSEIFRMSVQDHKASWGMYAFNLRLVVLQFEPVKKKKL